MSLLAEEIVQVAAVKVDEGGYLAVQIYALSGDGHIYYGVHKKEGFDWIRKISLPQNEMVRAELES